MRALTPTETIAVSGGNLDPIVGDGGTPISTTRTKNNNGYGNGAESGPAPGNSGATGHGKNENFWVRGAR